MGFPQEIIKAVSSPFVHFVDREIQTRNDKRQGRRTPTDSKPAALRIKSRKPLTPPPSVSATNAEPLNPQSASPLISTLPAELRELIWQAYFQGKFHVYWHIDGLRGTICQVQNADDFSLDGHEVCWKQRQRPAQKSGVGSRADVKGRLALVMTCRRIYSEAIKPLYAFTFFDFSFDCLGLLNLPKLMLPTRYNDITQLNFTWECLSLPPYLGSKKLDHFAKTWVTIWENFASMEGLRYLRVELLINPQDARHWTSVEDNFFEPIRKVMRPRLFELVLPFPEHPETRGLSCAVVQRK